MSRFFADDRLRRLFSFQALYAGVSPFRAIAAYAVIAQLDIGAGVWHPMGGIAAVPRALAAAAADAGVVFRYGSGVEELETSGRRVSAVRLAGGERLPADAVVVTTDQPARLVPGLRAPAPAGVLAVLRGAAPRRPRRAAGAGAPHDQLRAGVAGVFDELTRDGKPMSDPSLLVSMPSVTDRSLAPDGGRC